jgi:hypothetical protein
MEITQAEADQCFHETKVEWERLLKESGLSKTAFMITHDGIEFLVLFADIRKQVMAM